jgi:hypothetical protein
VDKLLDLEKKSWRAKIGEQQLIRNTNWNDHQPLELQGKDCKYVEYALTPIGGSPSVRLVLTRTQESFFLI